MTEDAQTAGNPLIILGDKISATRHLTAFVKDLKQENVLLDLGKQVKYAICSDSSEVATTLKKYADDVKMVIGSSIRAMASPLPECWPRKHASS